MMEVITAARGLPQPWAHFEYDWRRNGWTFSPPGGDPVSFRAAAMPEIAHGLGGYPAAPEITGHPL